MKECIYCSKIKYFKLSKLFVIQFGNIKWIHSGIVTTESRVLTKTIVLAFFTSQSNISANIIVKTANGKVDSTKKTLRVISSISIKLRINNAKSGDKINRKTTLWTINRIGIEKLRRPDKLIPKVNTASGIAAWLNSSMGETTIWGNLI